MTKIPKKNTIRKGSKVRFLDNIVERDVIRPSWILKTQGIVLNLEGYGYDARVLFKKNDGEEFTGTFERHLFGKPYTYEERAGIGDF